MAAPWRRIAQRPSALEAGRGELQARIAEAGSLVEPPQIGWHRRRKISRNKPLTQVARSPKTNPVWHAYVSSRGSPPRPPWRRVPDILFSGRKLGRACAKKEADREIQPRRKPPLSARSLGEAPSSGKPPHAVAWIAACPGCEPRQPPGARHHRTAPRFR